MTKDEIKRALKMCADTCFRVCCPYGAAIDCCGKLKRDALDLITEQEKEIKKQNGRVKCLKTRLANKMVLLANVEDLYESETQKLKEEKQILANTINEQGQKIENLNGLIDYADKEIRKLKTDNQELATALKQSEDNYSRAFERLKTRQREIERLKAENKKDFDNFVKVNDELLKANIKLSVDKKQAKIDVLNELRERITKDRVANDTVVINVNYEIKELIKDVQDAEDKG